MSEIYKAGILKDDERVLQHFGVVGMKWGIRRYQNKDGSLTAAGRKRYLNDDGSLTKKGSKELNDEQKKRLTGLSSRYSSREIRSQRDAVDLVNDMKNDKALSDHFKTVLEQNQDLNKKLSETHDRIGKAIKAKDEAYDEAEADLRRKYDDVWEWDDSEIHDRFMAHNPKYAKAYDEFRASMKQYYADCRKLAAKLDLDIPKFHDSNRGFDTTLVYTISKYAEDHPITSKYRDFSLETSVNDLSGLINWGLWATTRRFGFNPFEEE